jgi:hypothetical protein
MRVSPPLITSPVAFEIHGDPLDAKHCHCRQCQRLHGAPFQWAVIFPKTSVRIVKNENNALHFFSTETYVAPRRALTARPASC